MSHQSRNLFTFHLKKKRFWPWVTGAELGMSRYYRNEIRGWCVESLSYVGYKRYCDCHGNVLFYLISYNAQRDFWCWICFRPTHTHTQHFVFVLYFRTSWRKWMWRLSICWNSHHCWTKLTSDASTRKFMSWNIVSWFMLIYDTILNDIHAIMIQ